MNNVFSKSVRALIGVAIVLGLAACGKAEQELGALEPVAFHASDECHVCGMVITRFPGPKGQAVAPTKTRKFCSTAEMLGWWLQPENQNLGAKLYVHDMGRSDWNSPDDEHLIDATSAWYVAGTGLKGAMGVVLATFSEEQAARALADEHNGRVLRFEQIDQALLQQRATNRAAGEAAHPGH
ncbi:nitrous oxide reductase accessory protein NosL [Marinimicrobium locisalis]|uniref:nitrous oxide reductase accessory protein NosL n=1 Tax=Marinimicrobium locisalis TaxID=546022 RepID=UPI0032221169